ncbi:unnamed protein product, partial [marine sediment metagenome]
TAFADMDANDTAYVQTNTEGGARTTDIYGHATAVHTYFQGVLIC